MEALPVLIVEDNRPSQVALAAFLEHIGLKSDVAADGAEAVDAVKQKDYALILMDIMMPVMDGIEATKAIRALHYTMPIIAVTALDFEQTGAACLEAGINDFIRKPINLATLKEKLKRWCALDLPERKS